MILGILIVIFIIYIFILYKKNENFDVYRNYDFGAQEVYNQPLPKSELRARYTWSEKDILGNNVYDKMFENIVRKKIYGLDNEYAYRDINTNVYDTKFSILDGNNQISQYKIDDMYDPNITQVEFNGQPITLSQKQY